MTGETPETSAREDFAAALEVETPAVTPEVEAPIEAA